MNGWKQILDKLNFKKDDSFGIVTSQNKENENDSIKYLSIAHIYFRATVNSNFLFANRIQA